ncbi:MAG: desulfoferrodoxin [Firmicutes bacterium]|jgi:superoxide reductase|nr:desulfoferrodoxin [Bacillota bacterium]
MTKLLEIYKCERCGNIVEVVHAGAGKLVCCGEPMVLQVENTVDASREKHVPVVEKSGNTVTVTVGSEIHPMVEKHYIEWIELVVNGRVYRKFLNPGEEPKAVFECVDTDADIYAREYCNLHGLWRGQ